MDLTSYLTGLGILLSGMLITMFCAHGALRHQGKRQVTRLPTPPAGKV